MFVAHRWAKRGRVGLYQGQSGGFAGLVCAGPYEGWSAGPESGIKPKRARLERKRCAPAGQPRLASLSGSHCGALHCAAAPPSCCASSWRHRPPVPGPHSPPSQRPACRGRASPEPPPPLRAARRAASCSVVYDECSRRVYVADREFHRVHAFERGSGAYHGGRPWPAPELSEPRARAPCQPSLALFFCQQAGGRRALPRCVSMSAAQPQAHTPR